MIVTPATSYGISLAHYGPARSSGIHLSSILRYIALRTGALDPKYGDSTALSLGELIAQTSVEDVGKVGQLVRVAMGFAWEKWMAEQVGRERPGFIYQPGEVAWGGVIMTPDGVELMTDYTPRTIIHEFKLTWKSSAKPIQDEHMWLWQCMAGCYMLGKETGEVVDTAVIHPVYLAGNYRDNRDPLYRPVKLQFEQKEMEINWQMIMNNKDNVMPEVW